ncbi:RNA polymerase sigma factor [Streptomyces sp. NPDC053367]|uniref:RNA polymerase sigma factor n=1 Tax=Streptomyces sp. NPDC053367 TaxID=3365700 RepID=UPI0037D3253B
MTEQQTSGEPRARFEALVHAVAEPLHRFLSRRADADAVEDLLSETLLVLWRRIDDLPTLATASEVDPDAVLPWCYGVARGCLANARRADGRRRRLMQRLTLSQRPLPAAGADHTDLHDALGALRELDREIVLLWAWEGLAPRQIAEATGLTPNAVSIRLHRAKRRLATQLERKNRPGTGHDSGEGRSEG